MCIQMVYIIYGIEYFDIFPHVVTYKHPKLLQAGPSAVITYKKKTTLKLFYRVR